jgi:4-amino-4-deoxy-L-arabinose transferase-like glycosyltransferase
VWVLLLFLAGNRSLVWDEGMTLERIDLLEEGWSRWEADPTDLASWSDRYWRFSRAEPDGHGPFYALLSWVGHHATAGWLPPPLSYRVAPIGLFAWAVGLLVGSLRRHLTLLGTLTSITLLVTMPRLVPEVSFALIDGPLVSLAIIAFASFVRAAETGSLGWSVLFGAALGSAMATKLTGWFFPLPYAVWLASTVLDRDRRWRWRQVAWAAFVAAGVLLLWNVGWWGDVVAGVRGYFESNLTRRKTIPIPILFLGVRYDFSLPWYNTLVWTVLAVPAGTMVLGFFGAAASIVTVRADRFARLLLLQWLLLMVLRALPQAPGHDGTRQMIVSFAFLAMLAGWGLDLLGRALQVHRAHRWIVIALAISASGESVNSLFRYHPLELSYYSPLVGGLAGAERLGMEPTYFWDSLTPEVRRWLREETPVGRSVLFRNWTPSWRYLRQWNEIPEPYVPGADPPQWFVLQHRPGSLDASDLDLLSRAVPSYRKEFEGVALLSVFDIRDWQRSVARVRAEGTSP